VLARLSEALVAMIEYRVMIAGSEENIAWIVVEHLWIESS
jgi:hypothetical protein